MFDLGLSRTPSLLFQSSTSIWWCDTVDNAPRNSLHQAFKWNSIKLSNVAIVIVLNKVIDDTLVGKYIKCSGLSFPSEVSEINWQCLTKFTPIKSDTFMSLV